MQRYIVDNKELKLNYKDKRHIINVMRMKVNEIFEILYDKLIYTCKITKIDKKDVEYVVIDKLETKVKKDYKVIIASSIIKEQKMDFMLQKEVELGVDVIVPLLTERTIVKIDNKKDNKISRWNTIIKEASEQSFRDDVPILNDIISLKDIIKYEADLKIVCDTNEMSKNIKKVLQECKKSDTILIVVGPEGGLSSKEVLFLKENGFVGVTLGNNILRAETVPLNLLSIINYEKVKL